MPKRFCEFNDKLRCVRCGKRKDPRAKIVRVCEGRKKLGKLLLPASDRPEFITEQDLVQDTLRLLSMIPPNVRTVIGAARSGLTSAALISKRCHLDLMVLRQDHGDIVEAGHGYRLRGRADSDGPRLFVDDTLATGLSLGKSCRLLRESDLIAVIYCNPENIDEVDYAVRGLSLPHLLEWNLFNSVYLPKVVFDCDGILCEDHFPQVPKYLPRREPINICTARLESQRAATMRWLESYGIRVASLTMGPWGTVENRRGKDVGAWKGQQFKRFAVPFLAEKAPCPFMFVESDPIQARRIHDTCGGAGLVICPDQKLVLGEVR